jgi:hypothetical protein
MAATRKAMGITLTAPVERTEVSASHLTRLGAVMIVRTSPEGVERVAVTYGLAQARVRSAISGVPSDSATAGEWLRGRAKWYPDGGASLVAVARGLWGECRIR